jgi:hypothetical protein
MLPLFARRKIQSYVYVGNESLMKKLKGWREMKTNMRSNNWFSLLMIIGVAVMICPSLAQATIVNLDVYENASGVDVSQLNMWVDVTDRGTGVDFIFHNDSQEGVISNIYFEQTAFSFANLVNPKIINPQYSTVNFSAGGNPSEPKGDLRDFGGSWEGNLFSAGAKSSKSKIDPGEYLTIRFDYKQGIDFSDILTGLSDPEKFRMAQHVQGLSKCDASVWTVSSVPLPATLVLLAAGLPFIMRRRKI